MDAYQTQIYTTVLIICGVMGIFIAYFVVSIIRQQKRHMELQQQHLRDEMRTLEQDRGRIAADLHDELGPMLSAVKMKISSFDLEDEADKVQKEKTILHIDTALSRMREISFDLMPRALLSKGIVTAIRQFISFIGSESKMRIEFSHDDDVSVPEDKAIHIYRMVQELIQNSIRHAEATILTIDLQKIKDKVILSVKDNGTGFDMEERTRNSPGFGLRSLYNRTELMNGDMYVETAKGKGCHYTFEIPV